MAVMNTIIILCDANQDDRQLIEQSRKLVMEKTAQTYLLHVAASDPEFVGYEVGPQHERDWRAELLRTEHRLLQNMSKELRDDGFNAHALLVQGDKIDLILKEVINLNADLLIVGNHNKGLLERFVVGSTTDTLVHQLEMPILVIPSKS